LDEDWFGLRSAARKRECAPEAAKLRRKAKWPGWATPAPEA